MAQNFDTLFDLKSVQNMMNSFLSAPTGDMKSLMDTQLKNMKALNQTQQKMVETMQAAGKLQMQMLGDIMDSSSSIIREVSTEGTPQEKIAKQTALSKKA